MTQQTWLDEFYPVPANAVKPDDAIDHSLKKWIGLRIANRVAHKVYGLPVVVSATSCALCEIYNGDDDDVPCVTCPLAISRGGVACDNTLPGEQLSPFHAFTDREANPEPMIAALDKAKEMFHAKN